MIASILEVVRGVIILIIVLFFWSAILNDVKLDSHV